MYTCTLALVAFDYKIYQQQPNEENENEDEIDEQMEFLESCIEENIQKGSFS